MPCRRPSRPRLLRAAASAALLALAPAGAPADEIEPALPEGARAHLEAGRVVTEPFASADSGGSAARAFALVEAPPAAVWPVVRDCGDFVHFMPRTRESELLEREGDRTVCRMRVDLPFPFDDLESTVRSEERQLAGGGFERRWRLLRGDYRRSRGFWRVLPWGEHRERTLLIFEQDAAPRVALPEFLIRSAQRELLPDTIAAVRRRVRELADVAAAGEARGPSAGGRPIAR